MPAQNDPLLNAKQIAARLNVSPRLANILMHEMRPINVGTGGKQKLLRVRALDLEAWIQRRTQQPEYLPDRATRRPHRRMPYTGMEELTADGKIPYRKPGGGAK